MNGLPMTPCAVTDRLVQMLRDSDSRGAAEYGATVDRTDLSPLDWIDHATAENLDSAKYLQARRRTLENGDAQPAAAQEAVDAMLAMGFIWDSGAWRAQSDGGMQDERNRWFIRAGEYLKRAQDAEAKLASTPAAPGIDLTALWRLSDEWLKALGVRGLGDEEKRMRWALAKELRDALSLIDASPKGGSEARDAARWRYVRRKLCLTGNGDGTCGMQAINLPGSIPGWPDTSDDVVDFCEAAIDAAMQAQASDAEVRP